MEASIPFPRLLSSPPASVVHPPSLLLLRPFSLLHCFSHFSAKSFASFASALRCFLFMVVVVVFFVGAFSSSFPSSSSSRSFLFVLFFFSGTGRVERDGVGEEGLSSSLLRLLLYLFLLLRSSHDDDDEDDDDGLNPKHFSVGRMCVCAAREKKTHIVAHRKNASKKRKK